MYEEFVPVISKVILRALLMVGLVGMRFWMLFREVFFFDRQLHCTYMRGIYTCNVSSFKH